MDKKLTTSLLALIFFFTSVPGYAQQKNAGASDSTKGIERMSKELGLSSDQRAKVEVIFETERKKVDAIFTEEKQRLQGVQRETRASLEGVLTAEQMKKLDQKMRESARSDEKKK